MQIGWTPLQYFLQYLPGYAKTPIGGIIIFEKVVTSLIVSVVSGWELTIAS